MREKTTQLECVRRGGLCKTHGVLLVRRKVSKLITSSGGGTDSRQVSQLICPAVKPPDIEFSVFVRGNKRGEEGCTEPDLMDQRGLELGEQNATH